MKSRTILLKLFLIIFEVTNQLSRYWDDENPRLFREGHTQFPEEINVWAGINGIEIIGPFFTEENLAGQMYLNRLENIICPYIIQSLENQVHENGVMILNENNMHIQQDVAPPHYTLAISKAQIKDELSHKTEVSLLSIRLQIYGADSHLKEHNVLYLYQK